MSVMMFMLEWLFVKPDVFNLVPKLLQQLALSWPVLPSSPVGGWVS